MMQNSITLRITKSTKNEFNASQIERVLSKNKMDCPACKKPWSKRKKQLVNYTIRINNDLAKELKGLYKMSTLLSALIEEEGRYSVYVHAEGEAFAKRDVVLGERNGEYVGALH